VCAPSYRWNNLSHPKQIISCSSSSSRIREGKSKVFAMLFFAGFRLTLVKHFCFDFALLFFLAGL
jgi:hypothetical protein